MNALVERPTFEAACEETQAFRRAAERSPWKAVVYLFHHGHELLEAVGAIRALPTAVVPLSDSPAGRHIFERLTSETSGLRAAYAARASRAAWRIAGSRAERMACGVLAVAPTLDDYLRGSKRQRVRTSIRHAREQGIEYREITATREQLSVLRQVLGRRGEQWARRELRWAEQYVVERSLRVVAATGPDGETLAVVAAFVDGEWAYLLLGVSVEDDRSSFARYLVNAGLIDVLGRSGVRHLVADSILRSSAGSRLFSRLLGYEPMNLRLVRRGRASRRDRSRVKLLKDFAKSAVRCVPGGLLRRVARSLLLLPASSRIRARGLVLADRLLGAGVQDVVPLRFGLRMGVNTEDLIQRVLFMTGDWEPSISATIETLLAPGDRFVDVGSHIGFFTLLGAHRVGPSGSVKAFEPNPVIRPRLHENVAAAGLDWVEVLPFALGKGSGSATLHLGPAHNLGTSTLSSLALAHEVSGSVRAERVHGTQVEVEVRPLDEFLSDLERPTVVKLDAEGVEVEILSSLDGILTDRLPDLAIVTEFSPAWSEGGEADVGWLDAFVRRHGFRVFRIPNSYGIPWIYECSAEPLEPLDAVPHRRVDLLLVRGEVLVQRVSRLEEPEPAGAGHGGLAYHAGESSFARGVQASEPAAAEGVANEDFRY